MAEKFGDSTAQTIEQVATNEKTKDVSIFCALSLQPSQGGRTNIIPTDC